MAATLLLFAWGIAGCRVDLADVHRWESTANGPEKLKAIIVHDKYSTELKVEAAMALVRMKPRAGRGVGIKILVEDGLPALSPEARQRVLARLIPEVVKELDRPPPVAQAGQPAPPDGSFKYKDAAYRMLTFETKQIVADPELKAQLEDALVRWAEADFMRRMNDRSQAYSMEQMLRTIGARSVVGLPKLLAKDSETKDITKIAGIIAKLGDAKTKDVASARLVEVGRHVGSDAWRKAKESEMKEANRRAKMMPTDKQFQEQMSTYQNETLLAVYSSMKDVGGSAVIEFCLQVAEEKKADEKRRQAALAALEGNLDRKATKQIDRILAVAAGETPDVVLDQAFRRLRELPREKVIDKLYDLLKTDRWKLRRAAAGTVLQMSTVQHIDEFLDRLDQNFTKNFNLTEGITYGAYLGDLKEGDPHEAVVKRLEKGMAPSRLTVIGFFYDHGKEADVALLRKLQEDKTKTPTCEGDGCDWKCEVLKTPGDPKSREAKEIKTIGEYARYCIIPAVEDRIAAEKQAEQERKKKESEKAGKPGDKKGEKKGEKK
ncbi:MAG: hypothetical protein HY744_00670 [Deltaproteobacteria bacterium]|nr:hypothetical protein [Deltaproteobacteria bacterium]